VNPETETQTTAPNKKGFFHSATHIVFLCVVLVALLVIALLVGRHKTPVKPTNSTTSGEARMYLSPAKQTVNVGDTLTISIWEDSGSQSTNAVEADISYPTDTFELIKLDNSGSPFTVDAQSISSSGLITIARGHIGKLTGPQLVTKVNLKAKAAAQDAKISFGDKADIVATPSSKSILKQKISGSYTVKAN
jgi:hypothetical protein